MTDARRPQQKSCTFMAAPGMLYVCQHNCGFSECKKREEFKAARRIEVQQKIDQQKQNLIDQAHKDMLYFKIDASIRLLDDLEQVELEFLNDIEKKTLDECKKSLFLILGAKNRNGK
jgi:hypothetical protein